MKKRNSKKLNKKLKKLTIKKRLKKKSGLKSKAKNKGPFHNKITKMRAEKAAEKEKAEKEKAAEKERKEKAEKKEIKKYCDKFKSIINYINPFSETKLSVEDKLDKFLDEAVKHSTDTFVPHTGNIITHLFYMIYILKNSKNDCALDLDVLKSILLRLERKHIRDIYQLGDGGYIPAPESGVIIVKEAKQIAQSIHRCKEDKKVVAIPISAGRSFMDGNHANMLLFNYHRMKAEHYEPWGNIHNKIIGSSLKKKGSRGRSIFNLKPGIAEINKELKKICQKENKEEYSFKLEDGPKVCPTRDFFLKLFNKTEEETKGIEFDLNLQGFGPEKNIKKVKKIIENVKISEANGYCVAFSYLFLETRLLNLKISPSETIDLTFEKIGIKSSKILNMIRGQTKLLYNELIKIIEEYNLDKKEVIMILSNTSAFKELILKEDDDEDIIKMKHDKRLLYDINFKTIIDIIAEKWSDYTT